MPDRCYGARTLAGLHQLYKEADVVLNLCGAQELRRASVYPLPGLCGNGSSVNQLGVANGHQPTIDALAGHHFLFTYGENLGAADCDVPLQRFCWQPTRPPVCLDWWTPPRPPAPDAALTTVANWRHTEKDLVWQGETYYWSKHHEFLRFIHLPARAALPLELALGAIDDEERAHMRQHGWRIIPSIRLAEPGAYREYIRASCGEFTVAKDQNIRLRSGWFSDRSACYLAAQRPVITQDTGFGNILPTGAGLFAFTTMPEALAAIEMIAHDYARQSAAAWDIAQEFFAAERVLGDMLRHIGLL